MILTITPNPALDLSGEVDDIVPNEKNYVHHEKRHPGGNGINAARVIAALGVPVVATGFLGGAVGGEVEALLKAEGVSCRFIPTKESTRINITVSNQKTSKQTRFSFAGSRIERENMQQLLDLIRQDRSIALINLGGSFPPGFTMDDVRSIFEVARERGIGVVADVPSQHLQDLIQLRPILIKPNLKEFNELLGRQLTTVDEVSQAARGLNEFVPLVCISSVERGALMVTPTGSCFVKGPEVDAKSSVGAGDSMVGGIMAQLYRAGVTHPEAARNIAPEVLQEALRWGQAAALATVVTPGTELGKAEGMAAFVPRIQVKPLSPFKERPE
jgi:1-phosphofructokinase family hexose kinase